MKEDYTVLMGENQFSKEASSFKYIWRQGTSALNTDGFRVVLLCLNLVSRYGNEHVLQLQSWTRLSN